MAFFSLCKCAPLHELGMKASYIFTVRIPARWNWPTGSLVNYFRTRGVGGSAFQSLSPSLT